MLGGWKHALRLSRAGCVLARFESLVPEDIARDLPRPLKWAAGVARHVPSRWLGGIEIPENMNRQDTGEQLAAALTALGPTYIKLGQFLATRPDIVGPTLSKDLRCLQDRLPPFPTADAKDVIAKELGRPANELFIEFGDPVAAASIAQVHKAKTDDPIDDLEKSPEQTAGGISNNDRTDLSRQVAVKVLRPGVEKQFTADMAAFAWAAEMIERLSKSARRLEPSQLVATLHDSVAMEMDLRLEAAAASELAENETHSEDVHVPAIDWQRTNRRVLTTEWIDGIPIGDMDALDRRGIDKQALGQRVLGVFLRHALFNGFFHADMHQGNLFVEPDGRLVVVDFGIMGRLDASTRRFLAEILFGFLTRDYGRLADVHFEAGYVPPEQSRDAFAQALRSVGEPIFGRDASEISMARLLGQLFEITGDFDMHLQPQLVLLQKTMVVVEGVARDLDPTINIWETSRPIVEEWMASHFGPDALLQDVADEAIKLGRQLPTALRDAQTLTKMLSSDGVRLHPDTAAALSEAERRRNRPLRLAIWVGAAALAVIALGSLL